LNINFKKPIGFFRHGYLVEGVEIAEKKAEIILKFLAEDLQSITAILVHTGSRMYINLVGQF
jgi:hypothetical protein